MHRAKSEMNASTNFGEPKRLMDETTAHGEFISLVRVVALAQAGEPAYEIAQRQRTTDRVVMLLKVAVRASSFIHC